MFKVVFDGYEEEEEYETYEEAEEAALEMVSNFHAGAADLYNSNPGDYLEESGGDTDDYDIIET